MRRTLPPLVALAVLALPVLAFDGHTESSLAGNAGEQEVVITGHAQLDPDLHIERSSGTVELHCPACVLHKRQSASQVALGAISKAQTELAARSFDAFVRSPVDPVAYLSPRAPPFA